MWSDHPILNDVAKIVLHKERKDLTHNELDSLIEFFMIMCGNPDEFHHMDLLPELYEDYKNK